MDTVVSSDGTTIAFDQLGEGAPVVLVSGASTARAVHAQLAELLAADFAVFNYDRRGRGDSGDTLPYAIEREVEDLHAVSVRPGRMGAISTPTAKPASESWRMASRRRAGLGVPGSTERHSASLTKPTDIETPTDVTELASRNRSTSRTMSVPLVRIENGLAWSRRAARISRISRYRPSARW